MRTKIHLLASALTLAIAVGALVACNTTTSSTATHSAPVRSAGQKIPAKYKISGFAMGCQAYTFKEYSLFEAIEKTAECGGRVIEFFPGQKLSKEEPDIKWDHNASDETIDKVKAKLAQHDIMGVNYGVVAIPEDENEASKMFEFANKMGLIAITTESEKSIDTIEKMVRKYDVKVAFHNHPRRPNNPAYKLWDPNYVLALVKDRDTRIGACADTGHWVRSGLRPVDCLKILRGRVISSHLKDLTEFGMVTHDVPYGLGVSNVKGILDELKAQNFSGNISVEYEYHWTTSVPEVKACIDFVRAYGSKK